MLDHKNLAILSCGLLFITFGCTDKSLLIPDSALSNEFLSPNVASSSSHKPTNTGVLTANGWYEEEEIYYILQGEEVGVTERGQNQLYLIGGDRKYQANVALFIPGEPGYSVHWNVNIVHTAQGITTSDIIDSEYVSDHFGDEGVLFDDVMDILNAEADGLVTIDKPGVVVNCPIISEKSAEAPGNTELSEEFPEFPEIF